MKLDPYGGARRVDALVGEKDDVLRSGRTASGNGLSNSGTWILLYLLRNVTISKMTKEHGSGIRPEGKQPKPPKKVKVEDYFKFRERLFKENPGLRELCEERLREQVIGVHLESRRRRKDPKMP